MKEPLKNIIVIGASAGGLQATERVLAGLPAGLPVAVFIVIHLAKASQPGVILQYLQKHTSYTCGIAHDGEEITPGHVYLAPPDLHLFIKQDVMRLLKSPQENRWRPSIDVLFRSAAAAYGSAVTGIILSGMLDDGTSGMLAIERSGGICIVQEPEEAQYKEMPQHVISNVPVHYRVPVADIGYIVADTLTQARNTDKEIPEDIKIEAAITERMNSAIDELPKIGSHSNFTCPDCGGNLWLMDHDPVPRYRCHTGHVYNEAVLLVKQGDVLEEALWIAIRLMEERRNLLVTMEKRKDDGEAYLERSNELEGYIAGLKNLLVDISKNETDDDGYL